VHTAIRDTSNVNFTIGARKITVTAPNTAVTWNYGSAYFITWTSTYISADSVKIELNRSYPSSSWEVLQAGFPNTGTCEWSVTGTASTAARIRVTSIDHAGVSDTSNVNFIIHGSGSPRGPLSTGNDAVLPTEFSASQNYPNPFNCTTEIEYALPATAPVRLEVFNSSGQQVALLADGIVEAGYHTVQWSGEAASSGVYFFRLESCGHVITRKMMLMK
jgi:hypothetical protein